MAWRKVRYCINIVPDICLKNFLGQQNVLGKLDSPVAKMFNRLEEKWFERRYPTSEKHIVCDLRDQIQCHHDFSVYIYTG